MAIVNRVVVDVAVNTKESIASLNKLSKATKSYRDDTKVFKEIGKEQGKSVELYSQQMKMIDTYKGKLLELKKAREDDLKVYKESVKNNYGVDADNLTIRDVEAKKVSEHAKRLEQLDKLTKEYNKTLSSTKEGSNDYKRAQESLNSVDEERMDIIKRSELEADVAFSQVQAHINSLNVDISKHDTELGKLDRAYTNLKSSSDAFTDSIVRQGKAIKASNQEQYTESIKKADKEYEQSMERRSKAYNSIFDTTDRVGSTLVAATSATGALGVGGTLAVNKYLEHNYSELDVLRMARGSDEQMGELRSTMDHLLRNNFESNDEIFSLLSELIRFVEPEEYGDTLQNMAQNALNLALAGDLEVSEAANSMATINLITEKSMGDATFFHGLNQLQNEKGVDLGSVVQIIESSMSRLLNAGWNEAGIATLAGMTERLFARGNDAAARGVSELGEMIGSANFDTSEIVKYLELGERYGVNLTADDINDFVNGFANERTEYVNKMSSEDESAPDVDMKLVRAQADAYRMQTDLMEALGVRTVNDLYAKMGELDADEIFFELIRYLKTLTGTTVMEDGTTREVTLAEISESRGYLSNNAITQEILNNLFAFEHEYEGYKGEVVKGMEEGTSLDDEANIFRESDKAQFDLLKKELQLLMVEIGKSLTPAVLNVLNNLDPVKDFIIGIVDWIAELDPETIESMLKTLVGVNLGGWGLKGVGSLGKTVFGVSELFENFGNITGGNTKYNLRKTRDLAKGEASILKQLVDSMVSSDVKKGLTPLGLDEYTALAKQHVKVKGSEIMVTKDVIDQLGKHSTQIDKVSDVIGSVDDAGDVLNSVSRSVKGTTLSLVNTVDDLGVGVANTTTSIGAKFTSFLGSLSPLTQVALAVGAIAATGFAIHKINEFVQDRRDEERKWGSGNSVDKETRDKLEEVTKGNEEIMYEVRRGVIAGEGMEFSEEELDALTSRVDKMKELLEGQSDKWQELVDAGGVRAEVAKSMLDEITKAKEEADKYKGILEEIRDKGGVASDEQLKHLESIDGKIAETTDKSMGGEGDIAGYLTNTQLLNTMDRGERRDYVNESIKQLREYDSERRKELAQVEQERIIAANDTTLKTWTDKEYQAEVDKVNSKYDGLIKEILPRASYIAQNTYMGLFSSAEASLDSYNLRYTDVGDREYYENLDEGNTPQNLRRDTGRIYGQLEELSSSTQKYLELSERNKAAREIFNASMYELMESDFVWTVDESKVALESILTTMDKMSASQLFNLVGELVNDPTFSAFWDDAISDLEKYIRTVDDLSQLTDKEIQLYLMDNLEESEVELIEFHNLWENRTFIEQLLRVRLDNDGLNDGIQTVYDTVASSDPTIKVGVDLQDAYDAINNLNRYGNSLSYVPKGLQSVFNKSRNNLYSNYSYASGNYASGTSNHPGGMAILGDGFEQELVYEPGKAPYLTQAYPHKRDLAKGSVVIPYSKIPTINTKPYSSTPLYNGGVGNATSIIGDTNNSTKYEIHIDGVNASANDIETVIRRVQRDDELNARRRKNSGGES